MNFKSVFLASCLTVCSALPASAAIVGGFDSFTLNRNDDSSTSLVNLGFTANFFGASFTGLYVNNNGNVTFDSALNAYTPFNLTATNRQIIAPFFADVDTRFNGNAVTYGQGLWNGRNAFGVNWLDVGYYSSGSQSNLNSFQLLLVDRSDIGIGDFDIIFNYDSILWEAGTASGANPDGLGGDSARAGFSNGSGLPGSFFELTGSAVNGAFLNGGANALVSNRLNSDVDGRYIFAARNGNITPTPSPVPAPASLLLLAAGLLLLRRQSNS